MNKKGYWAALSLVLMISLLTGCRLADKEKGQTSEDLLMSMAEREDQSTVKRRATRISLRI